MKSFNEYLSPRDEEVVNTGGKIYVEIDDGTFSTVRALSKPEEFAQIEHTYNIDGVKNGSKVILEDDGESRTDRISGLKSLSLGIPIGINSASTEDLEALPGIGEKLARRIITYRNEVGVFNKVGALLDVDGMGEKKLTRIRPLISLD